MNPNFAKNEAPLILVIDDDRFMRVQLRQVLEEEGYRVEEAGDGQQGIEAFERLQPDVVLMDAVMPVMDGFACCEKLVKLQEAPQERDEALHAAAHAAPHLSPLAVSNVLSFNGNGYSIGQATWTRTEQAADRSLTNTPVLMITGLEDQQSVDQAFEVGAADYITKPIHWAVLRRRVRRLIEQCQMYRELEATNQKLEEVNQMLKRLASVDGLTQVANRRCFDEGLAHEWQRLSRERAPLSLVLTDIDYFKKYNDTYGHLGGDACLKRVAQSLARVVSRPADLVARYGGEEFAVILPHTDLAGAGHIAEHMRETVRDLAIEHSSSLVSDRVTLSLGVATIIPDMQVSPTTLINAADKALYLAKTTGRDRACLLTP